MSEFKKCPYCAEDIKTEAIKCKHCKSDLVEQAPPMQKQAPVRKPILQQKGASEAIALIVIIVAIFIILPSSCGENEQASEGAEKDSVKVEEQVSNMPPEDRGLYLINRIIDDDNIDEITYSNDSILISIDLNMVFTAQHAKYKIFDDSKKIFETLLDEYYSEVYII